MATPSVFVGDAKQLGAMVRALRKTEGLRQDQVGRFSHSFIGDLEAGKPTVQLEKVIAVLRELGVKLRLELPPGLDTTALNRYLREPSMTSEAAPETDSLP